MPKSPEPPKPNPLERFVQPWDAIEFVGRYDPKTGTIVPAPLPSKCSEQWKWQVQKGPLWPREKGPPVDGSRGGNRSRLRTGTTPRAVRSVRQKVSSSFLLEEWFSGCRARLPVTVRGAGVKAAAPRSGGVAQRRALTPVSTRSRWSARQPRVVLAVTSEPPGQFDSLQYRQIQIADLLEQLRGPGPGERFRQHVAPLPVLFLQLQERLHRVVPLLWPRSPVRWPAVPEPGFAVLAPLPVTRLPLRVRQRHKSILRRYVTERMRSAERSRGKRRDRPTARLPSASVYACRFVRDSGAAPRRRTSGQSKAGRHDSGRQRDPALPDAGVWFRFAACNL